MPFVVDYSPAAAIGKAGYIGGLGNWQREQQRLALQYDQMAFDAQRQQQSQQFAALQNALGMQNQRQARREELGTRLALDEMGRRRELEDAGRERAWAVEDRDAGFAAISERMAEDDARTAEMRRRETIDAGLADGSWILEPSVQKRIDKMNSDIGTWSNRDDVDEDVWRGKVEELNKRRDDLIYGSARRARPEERPKPTPQQFAEESVPLDMPDGSKIFVGRDRSGAWREITKWEPNQNESPEVKQAREDAKAQAKIVADAEKTLLARKKQIEDAERKWIDDAYKRFDAAILDPKADRTPPKDLAEKARKQFYDARPEDSMFMARFRAREASDAAQVTLPPRPSDLMTPPSPVVQETPPPAPVAPQQASPPVAQEPVQQAAPQGAAIQQATESALPAEVSQELDAMPVPVLQQALAAAERAGNHSVAAAISAKLRDRTFVVSPLKMLEMTDELLPLASQNFGSWNSDEFNAQLQQKVAPIADQLRAMPEAQLDEFAKALETRTGLFYRHRPTDMRSLRKVLQPIVDQEKMRRGPAEQPPEGFAFPNGDASKPPVPKARTIEDIKRLKLKAGDLFFDENDGVTKRMR